jgi:hypothetical protein
MRGWALFSDEDEFRTNRLAGALLNTDDVCRAFHGATSVVRVGAGCDNADVAEKDDSLTAKITGQIPKLGKKAKKQVLDLAKKRSTIEFAAKRGFSGGITPQSSVHRTSKYLETIGQGAYGKNLGAKPKLKKGANTTKKQIARTLPLAITADLMAGATTAHRRAEQAARGKTGGTLVAIAVVNDIKRPRQTAGRVQRSRPKATMDRSRPRPRPRPKC